MTPAIAAGVTKNCITWLAGIIETADYAAVTKDCYRKGGDGFVDQMIALAGVSAGCRAMANFHRKAAEIPGMLLIGKVSDG